MENPEDGDKFNFPYLRPPPESSKAREDNCTKNHLVMQLCSFSYFFLGIFCAFFGIFCTRRFLALMKNYKNKRIVVLSRAPRILETKSTKILKRRHARRYFQKTGQKVGRDELHVALYVVLCLLQVWETCNSVQSWVGCGSQAQKIILAGQGCKNPAFGKPCLCSSATCHICRLRRFRGSHVETLVLFCCG